MICVAAFILRIGLTGGGEA